MKLRDVLEELGPAVAEHGGFQVVIVNEGSGEEHPVFDVSVDEIDHDIDLRIDRDAKIPRPAVRGLTLEELVDQLRELSPAADDYSMFSASAWVVGPGEYDCRLDRPLVGFVRNLDERKYGFLEDDGPAPKLNWDNLGRWPGLPRDTFWTPAKVISGAVVLAYVTLAMLMEGPASAFEVGLSASAPILCIWMPEIMGRYEGWGVLFGRPITKGSPPAIVRMLGWLTLLLPIIQAVLIVWRS